MAATMSSTSMQVASKLYARCRRASGSMFGRHLLVTNLVISVSLSATGDVMQQQYDKNCKRSRTMTTSSSQLATSGVNISPAWDRTRTRNMAASGLTIGVLCHYWYAWLDRLMPGRTLRVVLRKLVVDQLVLSPAYITLFFVTVGVLEGASVERMRRDIVDKGCRLYVAEWFVWPVAQVVNFYFLSTRFRVLYDNAISLGFDVYTSYLKHGDGDSDKDDKHTLIDVVDVKYIVDVNETQTLKDKDRNATPLS